MTHWLPRNAQALAVLLLATACAHPRVERRVLVFTAPDSIAPGAVAAVQRLSDPGDLVIEVRDDPSVFAEDSLSRYGAVVFLNSSGDELSRRQQVDLERYVQAGGGVVGVGTPPARNWPWFNEVVGTEGDARARRTADGGRAVYAPRPGDFSDEDFLGRLRSGIRFAASRSDTLAYHRARTTRVPDATRFEQRVLVEGSLDEPTELAVARDGRVFYAERKGALKLYEPTSGEARTIAQLEVNFRGEGYNSENGLIGLALDPRFDENRWLYLNYTDADTLKHRVSRFTFTGEGIADERVMFEVPITDGCCHTGGSMTFDDAGNLLVSFGDNTNPFATAYAPIDDSPGRELWDARRSSANTMDLRGKIVRITPQPDGSYTIPAGNLFTDPTVGRPEIYTMGHRNPYRITWDRRTGFLYWGEVGPDARVDSIHGPKGFDEVNQARRAGNFGWPLFIADNQRYRERDFATGAAGELFDPARPVNDSRHNTGARVLPPAQPAFIWYPYDRSEEFPLVGEGGRNAMAGFVYYSDDYPESDTRLPGYYDGKLIHYDWIRGWMMATTMDPEGRYLRMEPFLEHLEFDHPIDMQLGPDGSLYLLEYGTYWFAKNPNARLTRVVFHGGNRPPVARIAASRTVGAAPVEVELSAAGSSDFDEGDVLTYTWTFADGTTATGPTVGHTFATPGEQTVTLVVTDAAGATSEAETRVRVGNAPPEVQLAVEGNRSFFWDAGPIAYHARVSDPEDGTLGNGIDPERVRITLEYLPRAVIEAEAELGHQEERTPAGLAMIQQSDCTGCHAVDQVSVGPSYRMIAERYAGRSDAETYVVNRIVQGSTGVWGDRVMPAHPTMRRDVAQAMARYILSLASGGATLPPSGAIRLDRHQPGESGAYVLTAAYVDQARNGIGPLRGVAEVTLRSPLLRAADVSETRHVGTALDSVADGSTRPVATAYADGAYLRLGRTDLTGVGGARLAIRSLGHPFTAELRAGGPNGQVLASAAVQPTANGWMEVPLALTTSGEHDLYLVFRSTVSELGQWNPMLRIDSLLFEKR